MIVDTSAVLAILFGEREARRCDAKVDSAGLNAAACRPSSFLEAAIVAGKPQRVAEAGHELDVFLERAGMELVPVTPDHARAARRAWRRFGKGNHPAGLNFGDCFSYALAESEREPLLFKGEDFARTDIEAS